ncbi:hypothetical protein RJ55_04388 [Drechmeria coniospora]|nr:hypothetical protein RJ55_04388 [Drechmeria coniospora]
MASVSVAAPGDVERGRRGRVERARAGEEDGLVLSTRCYGRTGLLLVNPAKDLPICTRSTDVLRLTYMLASKYLLMHSYLYSTPYTSVQCKYLARSISRGVQRYRRPDTTTSLTAPRGIVTCHW